MGFGGLCGGVVGGVVGGGGGWLVVSGVGGYLTDALTLSIARTLPQMPRARMHLRLSCWATRLLGKVNLSSVSW